MAVYTTIDDAGSYFNSVLWTGTGSSNDITGVGFQPDWVWIKLRSGATTYTSRIFDVVRGVTKTISSQNSGAESTEAASLSAFLSDGFTVVSSDEVNQSGGSYTYVGWNWKVNATSSTNSVGSVNVDLAVNTTAGISIGTYTGDGADGATFGHGLGVIPHVVLVKSTSDAHDWYMRHNNLTSDNNIMLDSTSAEINASGYNAGIIDDLASTTTWTMTKSGATDPSNNNGNGKTYVVYTFAEKQGYSKFGSYTGNGNADGAFVYTGFRPACVMTKGMDVVDNWWTFDNKREGYNDDNAALYPNLANAESDAGFIDLLSNGFKMRVSDVAGNGDGSTYIYMAFAESPFVNSEGVPTNAR
jgi:hypothetical protein|tara:strand:- start:7 stop:1077 length:1071 start_codon:yes stop_codon:yes gene_type:complete